MERAVEIKRRAQRFILNGDLDGALREYEKLVSSGDADPYHSVLLGDLLFKKGDQSEAVKRYLDAVDGYEKAGLFKNAIAVCKKMTRLSFAPAKVLERLANLHAQDGLAAEAGLYYLQHAELMMQQDGLEAAADSLRKAFDLAPDNVKPLERLAEVKVLGGDQAAAAEILLEAATHYDRLGQLADARSCRSRAGNLQPEAAQAAAKTLGAVEAPPASMPAAEATAADRPAAPPQARFEVQEPNVLREDPPSTTPGDADSKRTVAPDAAPAPVRARMGLASLGITPPSRGPGGVPTAPPPPAVEPPPAQEPPASPGVEVDVDALAGSFEVERFASMIGELKKQDGVQESAPAGSSADPAANAGAEVVTTPDETPESAASAEPSLIVERDEPADAGMMGETPASPGLASAGASDEEAGLAEVHQNLNRAQQLFREGKREAAGAALAAAAQAYDSLGRFDSAAAIYRSLSQAMDPPLQVMLLWLKNCQRRGDRREAGQVACVLGDRALNDGDGAGAREWFERARALDEHNEVVARRLTHLDANAADNPGGGVAEWLRVDPAMPPAGSRPEVQGPPGAPGTDAPAPRVEAKGPPHVDAPARPEAAPAASDEVPPASGKPAGEPPTTPGAGPPEDGVKTDPPAPAGGGPGKVAVSVDGGKEGWADLSALVGEFQRGVEEHIADDPQVLYDFGLSYREMGLVDEALESFRNASRVPAFTVQATEMMVRCLMDLGRADDAVKELRSVLARTDVDTKATPRLRYELGMALEAAGYPDQALEEYQSLQGAHAGLWDVAKRIDLLRRSREQS